jgi:hypothetical protein
MGKSEETIQIFQVSLHGEDDVGEILIYEAINSALKSEGLLAKCDDVRRIRQPEK